MFYNPYDNFHSSIKSVGNRKLGFSIWSLLTVLDTCRWLI